MALLKKGILVRHFDNPLLRGCIRISVGKPEHTDALLAALQEFAEEKDKVAQEQAFKEMLEEEEHAYEHEDEF